MKRQVNIDEIKSNLTESLKNDKDIAALYLFGSRADGHSTPMSDFDLAVLLKEPYDRKKILEVSVKASLALKTDDVDVLELNTAPVFLAHRVLREGILLFENDELYVSDYIEKTLRHYFDFKYHLDRYYKEYQTSLRLSYGKH